MSERPLSSAFLAGQTLDSADSSATRPCRALVVEAEAQQDGATATLYCRIALPAHATVRDFGILHPTRGSHIIEHVVYRLSQPTPDCLHAPDFIRAAHLLNVDIDALQRRLLGPQAKAPTSIQSNINLALQDERLSLSYEPVNSPSSSRSTSPVAPRSQSRASSPLPTEQGLELQSEPNTNASEPASKRLEWILVVRLRCSSGPFSLPDFASQIHIPVPMCLRNSLVLTVPSTATEAQDAPSTQWDLLVKPSLRSSSTSSDSDATTVRGSFGACDSLYIRWTTRQPHVLSATRSKMLVDWDLLSDGRGRAKIHADVDIRYAGLRDKLWMDFEIQHRSSSTNGDQDDEINIISLEGRGIVAWESLDQPPSRPKVESVHERSSHAQSALDTPRPRHNRSILPQPRPPSYSNLFEVAPPEESNLDPGALAALREPSLLRQAAPFAGDVSADMTFEAAHLSQSQKSDLLGETPDSPPSSAGSASPEAPDADDVPSGTVTGHSVPLSTSVIRIQLDLSRLLDEHEHEPQLSFKVVAEFSRSILGSFETTLDATGDSVPDSIRLDLPGFNLPIAEEEETVVTVAADDRIVELLPSDPMMNGFGGGNDSPLPVAGGKARWRTQRSLGAGPRGVVEVEVSSPVPSSVRLDDMDEEDGPPSPTRRLGQVRPWASPLQNLRTASSRSLRSHSSLSSLRPPSLPSLPSALSVQKLPSSLGLVRLRITPVPPSAPLHTWRLYTHLSFSQPYSGAFKLPLKSDQDLTIYDTWNGKGETTEAEAETAIGHDAVEGSARVVSVQTPQKGKDPLKDSVNEILYCVSVPEKEDSSVELGDVLPQIGVKVSTMEVEVKPVAGYDLKAELQDFDSATPVREGAATCFTKFQIQPSEITRLSVQLQPSPTSSRTSSPASPPLLTPAGEGQRMLAAETPPLVAMPPTPLFEPVMDTVKEDTQSTALEHDLEDSSALPSVRTLLRWLPILVIGLALAVAQLSETDGPLNRFLVGEPWPPTFDAKHDSAVASFVSNQIKAVSPTPVINSAPMTPEYEAKAYLATAEPVAVPPPPLPTFLDFFEPVPAVKHTKSLDTNAGVNGLVDIAQTWAYRIKVVGADWLRQVMAWFGVW